MDNTATELSELAAGIAELQRELAAGADDPGVAPLDLLARRMRAAETFAARCRAAARLLDRIAADLDAARAAAIDTTLAAEARRQQ